jgi:fucose permease
MAAILLVIIYIAFIGLGIPDSLFGTAWPSIYQEFGLPVSAASCVTLLISGGTVCSSLLSARVIRRFGTGAVTAFSTALTAAALLGFSFSRHIVWLCLFAVPLGLGAGAIDSGLNHYVALHYRAAHMNFLHCFYGIGVSLSPYLMSLALSSQGNWRGGYRTMFFVQGAIALLTIMTLPLWNRVHPGGKQEEEVHAQVVKFSVLARNPAVRQVWLVFISSCAIEYTCGTWGSTFLVGAKNMPVDRAAQAVTLFYAGMALGRFLSGIAACRVSSWKLIQIGLGLIAVSVVWLLLPLHAGASSVGLLWIGLGIGPIFPNLIHLTPRNFGKGNSQSVMGTQMAASYIGIMLMPPLFGLLAQGVSVALFPYFLLALFAVTVASTAFLIRNLKKQGRYGQMEGEENI